MKGHSLLPNKLIITGGKQRASGYDMDDWTGYDKAIAISIDNSSQPLRVDPIIDYCSPLDCIAGPDASITFKSGSLDNDHLWISTQTEIIKFDRENFQVQLNISLPMFNDVHHVVVTSKDTLLVTSTGLDAVFELDKQSNVINEWSCNSTPIWEKFDKETDYRKILTTKPHSCHPNFCFEFKGDYWVTRLKQQDTYCLQTGESIKFQHGELHDGIIVGNYAYFTHVKGFISKVDMISKTVVETIDMNVINTSSKQIGWCRGLHYIDETHFLVGFTRIRPSKFHQGLEWLKSKTNAKGWPGCLPTRVCLLNTESMNFEWEVNLEDFNINAVFSIL